MIIGLNILVLENNHNCSNYQLFLGKNVNLIEE